MHASCAVRGRQMSPHCVTNINPVRQNAVSTKADVFISLENFEVFSHWSLVGICTSVCTSIHYTLHWLLLLFHFNQIYRVSSAWTLTETADDKRPMYFRAVSDSSSLMCEPLHQLNRRRLLDISQALGHLKTKPPTLTR